MNKEEIKEILDNPKILMLSYGNYISLDDYVKLKDYITNLQVENKRLNNVIKKIEKMFNHEILNKYYYGMSYEFEINDFKDDIFEIIKGSDKE